MLQTFILASWEKRGLWAWLASPLGLLVCVFAAIKRKVYQQGWIKQNRIDVPVIVVGNIRVGGTGKTPLVAYLAKLLQAKGYQPGIICRGYRGNATNWPLAADENSDPALLGDEPVMLAKQTACPVMAGPDKTATAIELIKTSGCNIIISDDGFQHLKLARDIDIVVLPTKQKQLDFGNGWCLPAGPLRESISSLKTADILVSNGDVESDVPAEKHHAMTIQHGEIYLLQNPSHYTSLSELKTQTLHAVAGIGQPKAFFETLAELDLSFIAHPFADHQNYSADDLYFDDEHAIITTEKDAIKLKHHCKAMLNKRPVYVLPIQAEMTANFDQAFLELLK